ncbi:MAG: hypothetical protein GKR89_25520 [Candidatus Latescibacteria bacterium]|nr:hypothetical protein [Candidatus Latescibacterota bacterium]
MVKINVEAEELVYPYSETANNGSGPLWCYGAPLLVRQGEQVWAAGRECGEGIEPLCNTRWLLFRRDSRGWHQVGAGVHYDEREPCPLVVAGGRLLLSVNPAAVQGAEKGPCRPHLLDLTGTPQPLQPQWGAERRFTEHSYRGLAADGGRGEALLLNIDAQSGAQCWSWRDSNGVWGRQGAIEFPIRSCYPQVGLRERAGHILAIGDIVEPVEAWRQCKFEHSGRPWDYVFRRLFYTWTADITSTDFAAPVEVDEAEETAGHILNADLWIGPDGRAHLLYIKRLIAAPVIRDRFFPGMRLDTSLEYAVVDNGAVVERRSLWRHREGDSGAAPQEGRFHADGDGRLWVVCSGGGANYLLPAAGGQGIQLPLAQPFTRFFTNTERGGSAPSDIIDMYGTTAAGQDLRYARIRIGSG